MKKALFVLLITTIALTGFRKTDALVISFNDDNSRAIDLSKKNTSTASGSVTADTTKKEGSRRGELIPYKATGGGGKEKEGAGGKGGKVTSEPPRRPVAAKEGAGGKETAPSGSEKTVVPVHRPAAKTGSGN